MFCKECGTKFTSGKFCGNCGSKIDTVPETNPSSPWLEIQKRIEKSWENQIDISPEEFYSFTLADWSDLQSYLQRKTRDFLNCRTWSSFNEQITLSDSVSQSFWDTTESLKASLTRFQESIDPSRDSQKLIAAAGTQAKLSYGSPRSGQEYHWESVENIENELQVLVNTLRIGKKDNFIGESFDNHLEAIDLLSDFGRSFLVWYLGDTPKEKDLLRSWSGRKGVIASEMTAAVIAGASGDNIILDLGGVINPRFIHLLVDDANITQPWWMEAAVWSVAAETWKKYVNFEVEDLDLETLAHYLRSALDPRTNQNDEALRMFSQDDEMFQNLLNFLEG